ncbi:MAG: hypothetical protein J5851_04125 [Oscillospiraceae bacterium]|nr:hypothetical protein [Oscillospiraceae bacterium]
MKRALCIATASALLLALAACGKQDSTSSTPAQNAPAASAGDAAGSPTTGELTPGVLYCPGAAEGGQVLIRAMRLDGNLAGTAEGKINNKPLSDKDIRFIFELDEWVSVYLDTDESDGLTARLVPHQTDTAAYTQSFYEMASEDLPHLDLVKPEEADGEWGSFYLNPDTGNAGDYDLMIAKDGKPTAVVCLRFYNQNELSSKSDEELLQLMNAQ